MHCGPVIPSTGRFGPTEIDHFVDHMIGHEGTCLPWSLGASSSIIGTFLSAKPHLYPKESTYEAGEVQRPMKPNASACVGIKRGFVFRIKADAKEEIFK